MRHIAAAFGLASLAGRAVAEDLLFAPLGGSEKFAVIGNSDLDNGEPRLDLTCTPPFS